jgi:hypothetical protein
MLMSKRKFEQLSEEERRLLVSVSVSTLLEDLGVAESVKSIIDEKFDAFAVLAVNKHNISLDTLRIRGGKAIMEHYRDELNYAMGWVVDYIAGVLKRILETGEIPEDNQS